LHLTIRQLGLQPYQPVWQQMQSFTDHRDSSTADELWVLEHPPVFTQGQAGKAEHLLAPGDIPVIQVDRGGQVTYHGPGQVIAYPLIDLHRLGIGIKRLVQILEQVMIDLLADYQIQATRLEGSPGVYVKGAKIGSLGLRVRKGRTFHGLALNVAMDLEPFSRINPCGLPGMQATQLNAYQPTAKVDEIGEQVAQRIAAGLGLAPNTIADRLSELPSTA